MEAHRHVPSRVLSAFLLYVPPARIALLHRSDSCRDLSTAALPMSTHILLFFFLRVRMTEFNFSHGNVSSEEFHLPKCIVLLKMYFSIQHNLEDFLIPIFFFFFWVRMIEFTFSHGNKGKKLKLFGNFHNP